MEDRLQKFARLAELGSFTRAARELHISQPALTIAINKLEHELGSELLIRGNRTFVLTPAGEAAYQAAQEQQLVLGNLREALNRIAGKRPRITLGMTDSLAARLCSGHAFDTLEAEARLTIVVNNSRYLRNAVEDRQIDAAFTIDDRLDHPGLQKRQLGAETLLFVCVPLLAKTVEKELANSHLRRLISYDRPSNSYRHIQQALQGHGISFRTSLYSTSPEVMLHMVLRGRGVAALPSYLVASHIASGNLIPIRYRSKPLQIERPTCVLRLANRPLADSLDAFITSSVSA